MVKTALITGGAKRLGRHIALALAANGWDVVAHYNSTQPDAELKKATKTCVQADLMNANELSKLFEHGKIDLLINSASIYEKIAFAESAESDFERNFALHVKAPYFLSQKFSQQGGSHIINIIDAFVVNNKTKFFPYLLSKKSLLELSHMLAVELAPKVRVNAILPGVMREFNSNLDPDFLAQRKKLLPQGDFASANEVVQAINFLADSNLTGQEIYVDSGEHLI